MQVRKMLPAICQRVIAYNALIIRPYPPVAVLILNDGIHITQIFKVEYGKVIPVIGRTILIGTHPQGTVGINHQTIQGVFRNRFVIVLVIPELQELLCFPVELQQSVMICSYPHTSLRIFLDILHENSLIGSFSTYAPQPLSWRIKPLVGAWRKDFRHAHGRHPIIAMAVDEKFIGFSLWRLMLGEISIYPKGILLVTI